MTWRAASATIWVAAAIGVASAQDSPWSGGPPSGPRPAPARNSTGTIDLSVTVDGTPIAVRLYRPAGPGAFPLAVLSHGSPRNAEDRIKTGPDVLRRQAEALAAQGIAVAVPVRRGYGGQGEWAEGYGPCSNPDYVKGGLGSAADIRAAMAAAAREPGIDGSRIVLIGHSAGGWGSVAAASQGGVLGVVDFAGGRGSQGPDQVCGEEKLLAAAARFGRTSTAQELWIFSRNDHFFGPDLAARMHGAFVGAGGKAELVMVEPSGRDGHQYVHDIAAWMPRVTAFLRRIGVLTGS